MKQLLTFILVVACGVSRGQNLVPNPSFEEYDTCPYNLAEFHYVIQWYQPTIGTPDYYNECITIWGSNAPSNFIGYQYARTGTAYAGFMVFSKNLADFGWVYREYIQIKLTDSLEQGKKYDVSFYVSLSDSSNYASDDIALYFSTDSVLLDTFYQLNVTPQIANPEDSFITDKENWIKISGEYIANGGEKFITVGNFKDDFLTDTTSVPGGGITTSTYRSAYYYIDDVSIIKSAGTSIDLVDKEFQISLFPNPTNSFTTLKLHELPINPENDSFVEIFNMNGVSILKNEMLEKEVQIDLSEYPNGLYLIKLFANRTFYSKKLFLVK